MVFRLNREQCLVLTHNHAAEMQWVDECKKFTSLKFQFVDGVKPTRVAQYHSDYEVLFSRYSLLLRDLDILKNLKH